MALLFASVIFFVYLCSRFEGMLMEYPISVLKEAFS